ncbi:Thymidine kinase 2-like 2 [Homarus americanus]|uniref:Thymidine kinase 2-like 2 n=1 Tax=Homarus americanus TaxID=6706 RepID=A0A8J5K0Y0_HOMAM|nr:Thymidine kinase 2-like 2 [Homarus americanus]
MIYVFRYVMTFTRLTSLLPKFKIKQVVKILTYGDMSGAWQQWCNYASTSSSHNRRFTLQVAELFEQALVHKRLTRISLPMSCFTSLENGPSAKFTVCVEGNIGSGKSTLLKHFSQCGDVEVLEEPVDKWRNVRGCNLLDPSRWAHTFQAYVQMTMLEHHLQSTSLPVKLIERSVYSGRYCFVENLFRSGKLLDAEFSVYCEWFRMITQHVNLGVDLIVYMRTDPCKLHDRIRKRSRSEEQTIPIQYLEDLHRLHEEWLIEKKYPLPCPVLVLDANDSLPVMYKKFEEHTSDILCKKLVEGSVMGASVITQPSSPVKAVV